MRYHLLEAPAVLSISFSLQCNFSQWCHSNGCLQFSQAMRNAENFLHGAIRYILIEQHLRGQGNNGPLEIN